MRINFLALAFFPILAASSDVRWRRSLAIFSSSFEKDDSHTSKSEFSAIFSVFSFGAVSKIKVIFLPFSMYETSLDFIFLPLNVISFPSCNFFNSGECGSFSFSIFFLSSRILSLIVKE